MDVLNEAAKALLKSIAESMDRLKRIGEIEDMLHEDEEMLQVQITESWLRMMKRGQK